MGRAHGGILKALFFQAAKPIQIKKNRERLRVKSRALRGKDRQPSTERGPPESRRGKEPRTPPEACKATLRETFNAALQAEPSERKVVKQRQQQWLKNTDHPRLPVSPSPSPSPPSRVLTVSAGCAVGYCSPHAVSKSWPLVQEWRHSCCETPRQIRHLRAIGWSVSETVASRSSGIG